MLIGVLSASLILGGALVVGATNKDDNQTISQKSNEAKQMISVKEAKEIALSKAEGYVEDIELEREHGKDFYEVEIENGDKDFDVHIDAYTGTVLAIEEDDDQDDDWVGENQSSKQTFITEQEAVRIAEKAANGTVIEMDLDEDDDRFIYEVELKTKHGKAEMDIDATTGEVLEMEYDDLD